MADWMIREMASPIRMAALGLRVVRCEAVPTMARRGVASRSATS
jgi:hypothetical protein